MDLDLKQRMADLERRRKEHEAAARDLRRRGRQKQHVSIDELISSRDAAFRLLEECMAIGDEIAGRAPKRKDK